MGLNGIFWEIGNLLRIFGIFLLECTEFLGVIKLIEIYFFRRESDSTTTKTNDSRRRRCQSESGTRQQLQQRS